MSGWVIYIDFKHEPCAVMNLIMGTFALAIMVTLSVIPERLTTFARVFSKPSLFEYAIEFDCITRSISLQKFSICDNLSSQTSAHPEGRYNFVP